MKNNMIPGAMNYDVAEEFYSFGSGGQELDNFAKPSLFPVEDPFGLNTDSLFDSLCPSVVEPPQWLTDTYNLGSLDDDLEAALPALNHLQREVADLDNCSASTSPCSSTSAFDVCSLSPSPSEDDYLPSPRSGTLSSESSSVDVQSLFELINVDHGISDSKSSSDKPATDAVPSTSVTGPIRTEKSGCMEVASPYKKPCSGERRRSQKTPEQKSRKKCQNRTAATRYRIKKKDEYNDLFAEAEEMEKNNAGLREKVTGLQTEIDYLKSLMLDVIKARLSKSSETTPSIPKGSILITNSSLVGAAS